MLLLPFSIMQALRHNPFKHPAVRTVDVALCTVWLLLWGVAAVVLCVWTDSANKAGSFLTSAKHARNGLCVLAWVEFLLVALLTATAALLFSKKCQQVFDSWAEKAQAKKVLKQEQRMQSVQDAAVEQGKARAAADEASRQRLAATPQHTAAAGG